MRLCNSRGMQRVFVAGTVIAGMSAGALAFASANSQEPREKTAPPSQISVLEDGSVQLVTSDGAIYSAPALQEVPLNQETVRLNEIGERALAADPDAVGYLVSANNYDDSVASSPEEALAKMREKLTADGEYLLPLYEEDGRTQIGVFVAGTVDQD